MIQNYLNANGQALFDSLSNPADKKWSWLLIEAIQKRFDGIDQWTTGGNQTNYVDIRFGCRRPELTSASAVIFQLIRKAGIPICRPAKWIRKIQPKLGIISSKSHPDQTSIEKWLNDAHGCIEPYLHKISNASGRTPASYGNAATLESSDMEEDGMVSDDDEPDPLPVASVLQPNLILYGPPGTGKTYATIDEALSILDPVFMAKSQEVDPTDRAAIVERRQKLKARFDELAAARRVRFVTFHQSFSYEDFVEGLRAESDEAGGLRYEVVDGIFKDLCDRAVSTNTVAAQVLSPAKIDLTGRRIWKMSLGVAQGAEAYVYDDCMRQGVALLGYGGAIDFTGAKTRQDVSQRIKDEGEESGPNHYPTTAVNHFINTVRKGDLLVVTDGNLKFRAIGEVTGDYRFDARAEADDEYHHSRQVRWIRQFKPSLAYDELMNNKFSQMTLYELRDGSIDRTKLQSLLAPPDLSPVEGGPQPYVLIIDEINRGNVSRIFGELITLIEPSKRAGAAEALSVTLPYSKKSFSVPGNVYLLGTMNTADRSLAGLDIALRRRFTFKEMAPQPDLLRGVVVDGVEVGELLAVMNERIEVLLDRDHALGHAYFMRLAEPGGNTLAALAQVFRGNVLPLLQEYFFEDWEHIALVLNDLRKPLGRQFVRKPASNLDKLFGSDQAPKLTDRRWQIDEQAFGFIESYSGILC